MIAPELAGLVVPIDSVRPYGRNPRRGDVAAIKNSLEVNGQYRPIVVNRRRQEVLAGNHTLAAALELGWGEVAATFVDVDEEQAARIVLADNRTNDLAGYDDGALAELLGSLEQELGGSGYVPIDLTRLLAQIERDRLAGADTEPGPLPDEPRTVAGDLWCLGDHRLLCGDATSREAYDALLGDEQVVSSLTDPPYGVSYSGGAQGASGADMDRWRRRGGDPAEKPRRPSRSMLGDANAELYPLSLPLVAERLVDGGPLYLWFSDSRAAEVYAAVEAAGFRRRCVIVWVKDRPTGSLVAHYIPRHEPILYASKGSGAVRWYGPTNEATVWEHPRPFANDLHPTQKPIALLERALNNSSQRGDPVLDPFVGSGSTLIACENLGRRCFAVEIDPGYCDVVVDRWQRHTGRQAELLERREVAVAV